MTTLPLKLGIDTGGTYTDAVLVEENDNIVATAKSLTTRHDLTVGIEAVLDKLPGGLLNRVGLAALSTTLSTNSVVEGHGAPVAVLLPGYDERQVRSSGLLDIFERERILCLPGGHDATGKELEPLDEGCADRFIESQAGRVSAFAVSSLFGVRNAAHEIRLRERVEQLCGRPVTCGHELSSDLDAPRRALTSALNARMIPIIRELILAVQKILAGRGVAAGLMIVKGDGSLINTETALRQPVGTVLSGPAASVIGACALSGLQNAIIADMGGTTTDIAVVNGGQAELGSDGVLIGEWKPMVDAVRVISVGLGGDSEVRFSGSSGLEIGPRRVVPLSLLAHQHPGIRPALSRQLQRDPGRGNNRFALALEANEVVLNRCSDAELAAWSRVSRAPVEMDAVAGPDKGLARAIARLQRKGLVIYSGFTPSDAAHVLGMCDHWCTESARLAALIWARQMRRIYGLGRWQEGDAETPSRHVFERVSQRISRALIEAGLHQHRRLGDAEARSLTGLLADLVFESSDAPGRLLDSGALFHMKFAADYPLVGVGAPASTFFPDPAQHLGVELSLPEHAEVANAFGAVMGGIVQRAHVTVAQPQPGQFLVHSERRPRSFKQLEDAIAVAETIAREQAAKWALAAGADEVEIHVARSTNHVDHDLDGELFLEMRITATASGRPATGGS